MSNLKPNLAITTSPNHTLSLTSVPTPTPKKGEVLIHVRATGICGSDVHFWKHGGIGSSKVTGELGLGHESSGEVVGLGDGVEGEGWRGRGGGLVSSSPFFCFGGQDFCIVLGVRWFTFRPEGDGRGGSFRGIMPERETKIANPRCIPSFSFSTFSFFDILQYSYTTPPFMIIQIPISPTLPTNTTPN